MAESYRTIRGELEAYGQGLAEKQEIVGLNKVDSLSPEEIEAKTQELATASGGEVFTLSGITGEGVDAIIARLLQHIQADREARAEAESGEEEAAQGYQP